MGKDEKNNNSNSNSTSKGSGLPPFSPKNEPTPGTTVQQRDRGETNRK